MKHKEHIRLLEKISVEKAKIWADLGSGEGAFTLALADLGGTGVTIYSVDKDKNRLDTQKDRINALFPRASLRYLQTDFTRQMNLPPLDGILMANSLHFIKDKKLLLANLLNYLKPGARFVVVEYNADQGNFWVPYPVSYNSLFYLVRDTGLTNPQLLEVVPSGFMNEMYSAMCFKLQ